MQEHENERRDELRYEPLEPAVVWKSPFCVPQAGFLMDISTSGLSFRPLDDPGVIPQEGQKITLFCRLPSNSGIYKVVRIENNGVEGRRVACRRVRPPKLALAKRPVPVLTYGALAMAA